MYHLRDWLCSEGIYDDKLLFRGNVERPEDLPHEGNELGDFYLVRNGPNFKHELYFWLGSYWCSP
jgi:hypothetical protein